MYDADQVQYAIVSGYIQIVSDGHYLPGFWSHPAMGGPFQGLVLLHDEWGLTQHIRAQVRHMAERGYYVIAPDLFQRQTAQDADQAAALTTQALGGGVISQVAAALHALKSHNRCTGEIGLIGWGFGGELALKTAVFRDDLCATVVFYGLPEDLLPAELRMLSCPLLALYAEQDARIPPENIERLRAVLEQSEQAHEVVIYPDVGRGFFDETRPGYHPVAAQHASARMLAFLEQQLSAGGAPGPEQFRPGGIY
ncbi:MAG: dienelactone hydrolase family protein [Chloroflexi bacterium]|nr:dienelactone hydrolase family protein [Chloroflexota bacterium]